MSLDRAEHPHPLIYNIIGSQYYEDNTVSKPRKDFFCDACEKNIPKGSLSKEVLKFYGCDGDWPALNVCGACTDDPAVLTLMEEIREGTWND